MASIGFYAEKCLPFHARTLDERPLGGTETGIVRLAESLASRGHQVTVFTSHTEPLGAEVRYLPVKRVVEWQQGRSSGFDVFVMVKDWWPSLFRINAKRQCLLTGDGFEQYSNYGLGDRRIAARLHSLLVVSEWHRKSLCEASGFPISKTVSIGNGAHLPYFEGGEPRNLRRLIYTSAPYRGLDLAAVIFREIRKQVPDAEFHVFSGLKVYDTNKPFQGPHVQAWERLRAEIQKLPGCIVHDNILQKELARELMRSAVLLYPASVPETCCISAIEAIAAGCIPVTSAAGALPETIGECGTIVAGMPGDEKFVSEMISITTALLTRQELQETLRQRCLKRAPSLSWESVAIQFEKALALTENP